MYCQWYLVLIDGSKAVGLPNGHQSDGIPEAWYLRLTCRARVVPCFYVCYINWVRVLSCPLQKNTERSWRRIVSSFLSTYGKLSRENITTLCVGDKNAIALVPCGYTSKCNHNICI